MQALLRVVYPPRCLGCDTLILDEGMLCGPCRAATPFIGGPVCDCCGVPVLDGGAPGSGRLCCDECLDVARPWSRGRAALVYAGQGRRLVLALKHGDRLDIAAPAARWMVQAARPILSPDMVIVPVPAHWIRMLQRRYNQAALLANEMGKTADLPVLSNGLVRWRRTRSQDGLDRSQRFENTQAAMQVRPRYISDIKGKTVLLVDDVMTSGATLTAASFALLSGGASRVCICVLARVAKAS